MPTRPCTSMEEEEERRCRGWNSWLVEQGLGARGSIFGFANSVSMIQYLLLPSRNVTETFFKSDIWRKANGNQSKIHRRGAANERRIQNYCLATLKLSPLYQ